MTDTDTSTPGKVSPLFSNGSIYASEMLTNYLLKKNLIGMVYTDLMFGKSGYEKIESVIDSTGDTWKRCDGSRAGEWHLLGKHGNGKRLKLTGLDVLHGPLIIASVYGVPNAEAEEEVARQYMLSQHELANQHSEPQTVFSPNVLTEMQRWNDRWGPGCFASLMIAGEAIELRVESHAYWYSGRLCVDLDHGHVRVPVDILDMRLDALRESDAWNRKHGDARYNLVFVDETGNARDGLKVENAAPTVDYATGYSHAAIRLMGTHEKTFITRIISVKDSLDTLGVRLAEAMKDKSLNLVDENSIKVYKTTL